MLVWSRAIGGEGLVLLLQQSNDVCDHLLQLILADLIVPKKNLVEFLVFIRHLYFTDYHRKL